MDDVEVLDQILLETTRIKKLMAETKGEYVRSKAILREARANIDRNPRKAFKHMTEARTEAENESDVYQAFNALNRRRQSLCGYERTKEEDELESLMEIAMRDGEYSVVLDSIKKLGEMLHDDVERSINAEVTLDLPDSSIFLNRGNTLTAIIKNGTTYPLRMMKLEGRSTQAQVIVFDEYRTAIGPGSSRSVRVNVIPNMEGDVVVELEGKIELNSRQVTLVRHASMKVVAPLVTVQTIQQAVQMGQSQGPPPAAMVDPISLVEKGTVDQWTTCIRTHYESKGAISLDGMPQKVPTFQMTEGYRSLFQALLLIELEPLGPWTNWFDGQGFVGEELTRRCTDLMFRLRRTSGQFEVELDGNVGSSNNNYLISALHIASGLILLDRDKRKDVMSWEITGTKDGRPFKITVQRSVQKGSAGQRSRSIFKVV